MNAFMYFRVDDAEPDTLTPETVFLELDEALFEVRKVSVLASGPRWRVDNETSPNFLYSLADYAHDTKRRAPGFSWIAISKTEFEAEWGRAEDPR